MAFHKSWTLGGMFPNLPIIIFSGTKADYFGCQMNYPGAQIFHFATKVIPGATKLNYFGIKVNYFDTTVNYLGAKMIPFECFAPGTHATCNRMWIQLLAFGSMQMQNSATGTRTRVARVRAEYPNQLDYSGCCWWSRNMKIGMFNKINHLLMDIIFSELKYSATNNYQRV